MPQLREVWPVTAGDFATAGEASSKIKRMLKAIGVEAGLIRRIAVATYEVEINIVIHSEGGEIELGMSEDKITVIARDRGPGIPDIDQAMCEGYSTATEAVRAMGFGAGMGLPNMRRNSDDFHIASKIGAGTTITMNFALA